MSRIASRIDPRSPVFNQNKVQSQRVQETLRARMAIACTAFDLSSSTKFSIFFNTKTARKWHIDPYHGRDRRKSKIFLYWTA